MDVIAVDLRTRGDGLRDGESRFLTRPSAVFGMTSRMICELHHEWCAYENLVKRLKVDTWL